MDANLIVGYTLIVIGLLSMVSGIAISVLEAFRPARTTPSAAIESIKSLLEAVAKLLAELAKFKPGAQLLLIGIAIFVSGVVLIVQQPL